MDIEDFQTQVPGREAIPNIVKKWILRALVPLDGHTRFIGEHGFSSQRLAKALGLVDREGLFSGVFDPASAWSELSNLHERAEERYRLAQVPEALARNVASLLSRGIACCFPETDYRILEFVALLRGHRLLRETVEMLGDLDRDEASHALAVLLDLPIREIHAALSLKGGLFLSGLLWFDPRAPGSLATKLDLLSRSLATKLLGPEQEPVEFLKESLRTGRTTRLSIGHFEHLGPLLDLLLRYLREAMPAGTTGLNILIHGPAGSGRTELGRVLVEELDCDSVEPCRWDEDGYLLDRERRLRGLRAAQRGPAGSGRLVLFDDADPVLRSGVEPSAEANTARYLGRLFLTLADNPAPTLWVVKSLDDIHPSVLEAFHMVLELAFPPSRQRERLLREHFRFDLPADVIRLIAATDHLSPRALVRVAGMVNAVKGDLPEPAIADTARQLLGHAVKVQRSAGMASRVAIPLPGAYDTAFVNVDMDLAQVAKGLAGCKSGRLLFCGPPGTGKTAYAHWLARELGVPVYGRSASDLLSKWIGETERNIAEAFAEAEASGAMLVLDEVDSFLAGRKAAIHAWEVTQVNEFLVQLEQFGGLLAASTNFAEALDPAALRRFDLKLRFDYLLPWQAWLLFCRQCVELGLEPPAEALRPALARLSILTPGDFAFVARQHRFRPVATGAALLAALENECALKPDRPKAAIGFV